MRSRSLTASWLWIARANGEPGADHVDGRETQTPGTGGANPERPYPQFLLEGCEPAELATLGAEIGVACGQDSS
jgi:hypothetical protein